MRQLRRPAGRIPVVILVAGLLAGGAGTGLFGGGAPPVLAATAGGQDGSQGNAGLRLEQAEVEALLTRLDADRRLLAEMRKPVPLEREDALHYLEGLKRWASRSDPARLAPLADRVLAKAPAFYDWMEQEFDSTQESAQFFQLSGAQNFQSALERFEKAVLLTVINRLDAVASLLKDSAVAE